MNLQTRLDARLWAAVQVSYEKRNYTGAILDSVYFLTDLIRQKSGLEGDGAALVGQALGGNAPKLKLNKLQTESDRNIQSGVEQLLRGFYQAVRNPRSHGKYTDSQEDTDTLILFVNYLLKFIDQSKSQFDKEDFLIRVFDADFPDNMQYARTLVSKIPEKDRYDTLIDVFRQKEHGKGAALRLFMTAMLEILKPDESAEFHQVISEDLETTNDEDAIRRIISMMPQDSWCRYSELAKIRIEKKLIQSIADGMYNAQEEKCLAGSLGTWARGICRYFTLKSELSEVITRKLSGNDFQKDYVFYYVFACLRAVEPTPGIFLQFPIKQGLKAGDKRFYDALDFIPMLPETSPWVVAFKHAYDTFVQAQPVLEVTDDDVPF